MSFFPRSRGAAALLASAAGLLVGAVAGAGAMLIAYPFLFPPPAAADAEPAAVRSASAARSSFRFDEQAPGRDPVHWADGSGSITRTEQGWVLRLNADFKAGPGPNYWIYLNSTAVGEESDFNADARRVKVAKLRSFEGAQNYLLPESIGADGAHTLTIWCESFGAYIGSAVLQRQAQGAAPLS